MPVTINGTTGIVTPALVNGTALSFRNKIINGNFDIWQRGTSLGSGTGARYLADRFVNNSNGSTYTVSRQSFSNGQTDVPNNPDYYISASVASVAGNSNRVTFQQDIESVKTLSGKTATLSFYAKADSNKSISIEFIQDFGSGGSPSAVIVGIGVQKLNLTTSWQKFTVTANIPSISGKTIGTNNDDHLSVIFWFDAGSDFNSRTNSLGQQSGTFDIAQVQLEEGSVATPFEVRPIGTELALCQRYYEKSYELNVTPGTAQFGQQAFYINSVTNGAVFGSVTYKVPKRAAATITLYSYNGTQGRWSNGDGSDLPANTPSTAWSYGNNINFFPIQNSTGGTLSPIFNSVFGAWTASAEL
jgi:hypothetical protein